MRKNKKNKKLLLILIILGITVGFALLSTTLNIIGTAGINKNTWDIHWNEESIVETQGSVTAINPASVTDTEKKNISFEVELEQNYSTFFDILKDELDNLFVCSFQKCDFFFL